MKKHGRGRTIHKRSASKNEGNTNRRPWVRVAIAALIAAAITIVLIALYSFSMYMGWLDASTVPIANIIIKALGAMIAGLIAVRGAENMRILLGGAAGGVYIILAFIVFSILSGNFTLGTQLLLDIGMGILAGILAGMLYGVFKRK